MAPENSKQHSKLDKNHKPSRVNEMNQSSGVDKADESKRRAPGLAENMTVPHTPPPPYSPTNNRTPATPQRPRYGGLPAMNTPVNSWTRYFPCQTDSSFIMLNTDGSKVYYSKGDGPAASMPTRGSGPRQYFCGDGSTITLSQEGWIEFVNRWGQKSMLGSELGWHQYANQPGWFAHSPRPESPPVATTPRVRDVKRDSAYAGSRSAPHKNRENEEEIDSDLDSDEHDDMYKYRGLR